MLSRPESQDALRRRYELARSSGRVRYARIRPDGLELDGDQAPRRSVEARIAYMSPARTLYEHRRPTCRSLNGVRSLSGVGCDDCPKRLACTPQVLLHFEVERTDHLHALVLALTSANNLAAFLESLDTDPVGVSVRLGVTERTSRSGRPWGELTFSRAGR